MSDLTNAERQARHRAKERERVQQLEREVRALRNATPEQQLQLVRDNQALRDRIRQLEQASAPSDLKARMEFYKVLAHYEGCRASALKAMYVCAAVGHQGKKAEAEFEHRLDLQFANSDILTDIADRVDDAYDEVQWQDDDRIDEIWQRDEDGSEQRAEAGEVATAPEAADR